MQTLTLDHIRQSAPSAFAVQPFEAMSSRYTYIPTSNIIEGMQSAGFLPVKATQSRARDLVRREFTKHMIRFRSAQDMERAAVVGELVPEIVLVNSHDGTSAYKLMLGIFRFVCTNGMTVSDSEQQSISIRHQGDIIEQVIQGSNEIVSNAPRTIETVSTWQRLQLTAGEQGAFAESARTLRFADSDGNVDSPITAEQLLRPRRSADNGTDLWKTLNRVQENVIRGGLHGWDYSNRRPRRVTTREVKGIDQDVKLNRALWQLAERMAELKGVSAAA